MGIFFLPALGSHTGCSVTASSPLKLWRGAVYVSCHFCSYGNRVSWKILGLNQLLLVNHLFRGADLSLQERRELCRQLSGLNQLLIFLFRLNLSLHRWLRHTHNQVCDPVRLPLVAVPGLANPPNGLDAWAVLAPRASAPAGAARLALDHVGGAKRVFVPQLGIGSVIN